MRFKSEPSVFVSRTSPAFVSTRCEIRRESMPGTGSISTASMKGRGGLVASWRSFHAENTLAGSDQTSSLALSAIAAW